MKTNINTELEKLKKDRADLRTNYLNKTKKLTLRINLIESKLSFDYGIARDLKRAEEHFDKKERMLKLFSEVRKNPKQSKKQLAKKYNLSYQRVLRYTRGLNKNHDDIYSRYLIRQVERKKYLEQNRDKIKKMKQDNTFDTCRVNDLLNLPMNVSNALLINEIYDMGSLMKLTIIDLLGFKNLGIKGVTAINKELYEYGLFLNEGTI
jgi:hypothetical protein